MPKIQQYTATEAPAVANAPSRYGGSAAGFEEAQAVAHQAQREFGAFANVQFTLQHQVDDLQFTTMEGQYKAGIDEIHQDLERDPILRQQPGLYERAFVERRAKLVNDVLAQPGIGDRAKNAFGNYLGVVEPKEFINARGRGLKLVADSTVAGLQVAKETLSTQAGTVAPDAVNAQGENIQQHAIKRWQQLLDDAYKTGFLKEEAYARERTDFHQQFLLKNASYYATTNPWKFNELNEKQAWAGADQEKLAKIAEGANQRIASSDRNWEQAHNQAKAYMLQWAVSAINRKEISYSFIKDVAEGRFPMIDATHAPALLHALENPVVGDTAVRAIMDPYYRRDKTDLGVWKESIDNARQQLDAYVTNGGHYSKEYSKALEHLSSEEKELSTAKRTDANAKYTADVTRPRSDVSFAQGQLHEKERAVRQGYDARMKPLLPMMRSVTPNVKEKEVGQLLERLRQNPGADPQQLLDNFFKQKEDARKARQPTQQEKDFETLRRGRR